MPDPLIDPEPLIDIARREGVDHLTAYFAPGAYTGQWFETFAAGGDPHRIAAEDLYAVEALSVQVPFAVGRELLEGQLGRDLGALLEKIPTGAELGTEGADELVADHGPAYQAWHLLKSRNERGEKTGVGRVIAGKLLARKRPKLIPVYDAVVSCQFGEPDHVWLKLHAQLADGELRTALARARATVGVDDQVSILRALDVILWRRHVKDHRKTGCPKRGSAPL